MVEQWLDACKATADCRLPTAEDIVRPWQDPMM